MEILTDSLTRIVRWNQEQPEMAILAGAGAYLLLLVLTLWTLVRYGGMARRQARLLKGADGASLEMMLLGHADGAASLRSDVLSATQASAKNAGALRQCLQRVGIVRYDAYGDVGGCQSFSLALLDAEGSGIVVTGLHGRSDMRLYAKPVIAGVSPLVLTDEERQAITESRVGGPILSDDAANTVSSTGTARRR
ncbi:MAG: DUF4446 family protein [Cytophagales bacterium]|nr:DUF4446 family protein [Armatimonadota bacterium]